MADAPDIDAGSRAAASSAASRGKARAQPAVQRTASSRSVLALAAVASGALDKAIEAATELSPRSGREAARGPARDAPARQRSLQMADSVQQSLERAREEKSAAATAQPTGTRRMDASSTDAPEMSTADLGRARPGPSSAANTAYECARASSPRRAALHAHLRERMCVACSVPHAFL